jgi:predicted O-methyltransferase YrrM
MRVMVQFGLWCLGLAPAETQTSEAERECLVRYASGKKRIVEIGVWQGVTTCRLRQVMHPQGVLIGVDPFPKGRFGFSSHQVIAHREVERIPNGSVQWRLLTGVAAARAHRGDGGDPVDFVFIDGDHSYNGLRNDWEAWSNLIAPFGIIALHDSRSSTTSQIDNAGSVIFTKEVILPDSRFEVVETVDTLTVLRLRG